MIPIAQALPPTPFSPKLAPNMPDRQIPKAYEPTAHEDAIYAAWEKSGFFNPDNLPGDRKEPFCIVLPPPNVTGTLHMGHAAMLAIQDLMVRFERMRGKKALWIPGTDHAAIATQSKVEKLLTEKGMKDPRRELGRERFLDEVRKFAKESHDTIVNQAKKMGSSLDWSREAYTLDEKRSRAVNLAFRMMYDDGLMYRAFRVVNWDPVGRTTISDDEVNHKEGKATLYTFTYSKDFPIAISTTRPETKVGDTAVAVHPTDERYKKLVGKTFDVAFAGAKRSIKVVADESVDPAFGTGALGVTPAHSAIDADIAKRHGLPTIQVIGEDARMLPEAGSLVAGKTTLEARAAVVAWLRDNDLLQKEEEVAQNISVAERTGAPIEPLPKLQWFIDVNKPFRRGLRKVTLKKLMQDAVKGGTVKIMPERFEKTYFHWIDNLRDWNVSRQIWFGHRVPVWYRGEEVFCGESAPEGDDWVQDEDTLDTWFSSGLWTFSTLGWPEKTKDLATFHPTSVLETGYDILFFWVARMILMSQYVLGEAPFKEVYLHGLIRDEHGRKMSKSLGNIIDPLDMIAKYGADATRLSLVIGSTPGNDVKLSEEKVAGFRNFTNKLWNISRFVLTTVNEASYLPLAKGEHERVVQPQTLADRWILSRLGEVTREVTNLLNAKAFSAAGELLRDFTWNEFADWYLEIAKAQRAEPGYAKSTDSILIEVLRGLIALWHPFMPYVTEVIWGEMKGAEAAEGAEGMLMVAEWPEALRVHDEVAEREFSLVREIVGALRGMRADYKVEPGKETAAAIAAGEHADLLTENAALIRRLARVGELTIAPDATKPDGSTSAVVAGCTIYVPLAGLVDVEKERARLQAEIETTKKYVETTSAKLENKEFVGKAPEKVVADMRAKLDEAHAKLAALEGQLNTLH
ncbi:valine--tRNA ligase [Patescibacteria group bacterium]|nr:MAG: valine--tRNA ligase [Patescibacteria group bacterium]